MIGLIQRVSEAAVRVDGRVVGEIGPGLLALVCAERGDTAAEADRLLEKLLNYRVFSDAQGKMNLSLRDLAQQGGGSGLLLVPQFTLAADTAKGTRASFTTAAEPGRARVLFAELLAQAREAWPHTCGGVFGAEMQVSLVNDGPVTFWLEAAPGA